VQARERGGTIAIGFGGFLQSGQLSVCVILREDDRDCLGGCRESAVVELRAPQPLHDERAQCVGVRGKRNHPPVSIVEVAEVTDKVSRDRAIYAGTLRATGSYPPMQARRGCFSELDARRSRPRHADPTPTNARDRVESAAVDRPDRKRLEPEIVEQRTTDVIEKRFDVGGDRRLAPQLGLRVHDL